MIVDIRCTTIKAHHMMRCPLGLVGQFDIGSGIVEVASVGLVT
jgi:hypothetical protein